MKVPDSAFERALGMSPATLAEYAEVAAGFPQIVGERRKLNSARTLARPRVRKAPGTSTA